MAKILIVDDSSLARRMLRQILEQRGHTTLEASEGLMAIEQYFIEKPDLVLLDLVMTGMPGLEVLEQLCQMDRDAKIIVATADLQDITRCEVEKAGAKAVINKPFMATKVIDAVNGVLGG
ncbi:response regulator [Oxynema sp. CENA135]|uniref:Response regulator n=1 Tax=Oxynema aestuarii AP17 TaxID=2064643 RepID=A0A6H1TUI5_9CYAN|nr:MULTISPECIES: response regulator [Oxynema]MBK4730426.1 response regulator [Oxynema sp. CENA135]QIZ70252.1 response regulator [Oxynema aestuarii AP17]RMH75210.1 MAG: response regulator [Cyanobacteria bacterium J007]